MIGDIIGFYIKVSKYQECVCNILRDKSRLSSFDNRRKCEIC